MDQDGTLSYISMILHDLQYCFVLKSDPFASE